MPTVPLATRSPWARLFQKKGERDFFICNIYSLQGWISPLLCCQTLSPQETLQILLFLSSSCRSAILFHIFPLKSKYFSFFQPKSTFTSRDSPATLRCRVAHALEVAFDCDGERMKLDKLDEGVDKKTGSKFLEASVRIRKGQVLAALSIIFELYSIV